MSELKLIIGTKNLSSWSLRPWFFLKQHQVPFAEQVVELDQPGTRSAILRVSPSGRVPALVDGETTVWESLAICEYAAERFDLPGAWPADRAARAQARSIAAEMHAGFAALREALSFDATRRPEAKKLSEAASADVARVIAIWREARERFGRGGEWLFGAFGIADAMFAPVAMRFYSYAIPLEGAAQQYLWTIISSAPIREWIGGAFLDLAVQKPKAGAPPEPARVPIAANKPAGAAYSAPATPAARVPPTLVPGNAGKASTAEPEIKLQSHILPP